MCTMVFKEFEELCARFGDLSPHKRIEILCGMLRLCLAPELRFIGSVVEDLARKDYNFLREHEIKANRQSDLLKYYSVDERTLQNAMAFNLALLHSWNTTCANIIFDILETNMKRAFQVSLSSDNEEKNVILLVLTMAMNHPAFTFHQRNKIIEYYKRVEEQLQSILAKGAPEVHDKADVSETHPAPHPTPSPVPCPNEVISQGQGVDPWVEAEEEKDHIENIELVKVEKSPRKVDRKRPSHHEYRLRVTMSNGETAYVTKSVQDFTEFQKELVKLFPKDGDVSKNDRKPLILGKPSASQDANGELITNYIKQILTFPKAILDSDHVINFFRGGKFVTTPPAIPSSPCPASVGNPTQQLQSPTQQLHSPTQQLQSPTQQPQRPTQQCLTQQSSKGGAEDRISPPEESVIPNPPTMSLSVQNSPRQDLPLEGPVQPCAPRLNQSSPGHTPAVNHVVMGDNSPWEQDLCLVFSKLKIKKPQCLQDLPAEELLPMDVSDLIKAGLSETTAVNLRQEMDALLREKGLSLPNGITDPFVVLNSAAVPSSQAYPSAPHASYIIQTAPSQHAMYHPYVMYSSMPHAGRLVSTQDSTPPGSDCSSPTNSPQIQKKAILNKPDVKKYESSSDENDKGRTRSPLTDRKHIHHSVEEAWPPRGRSIVGSGYQSDPSSSGPAVYHTQMVSMPGPYKAQPAHTNLNIPPKNMISMPPDSPGILFAKRGPPIIPVGLAPPIPRTEAVTVSSMSVLTTTISSATPTHDYSKRLVYTMPLRSPLSGGQRSFICNVTNSTTMTMTAQPVTSGMPHPQLIPHTVSKGQLSASSSEPNLSAQQMVQASLTQQPSVQQQDSISKSIPSHNASPIPGSHNAGSTLSQHLSSTHTSCTSCGCPGHSHMTAYPYFHPLPSPVMPNPLLHVAHTPTSNGIIPAPHLLAPGYAYHLPNGLTPPDILFSHHNMIHGSAITPPFSGMAGGSVMNPAGGGGHLLLQRRNSVQDRKEKPRRMTCHNCGSTEHVASECTDNSMESISGHFHLNYEPKPSTNAD